MSPTESKRRSVLVDPRLQTALTLNVLGWLALYIVLFAGAVNGESIWTCLTAAHDDPAYVQAVARLSWFARSTALPLSVMFVGVAAHGVVFAHRVAGPIHRIETVLRAVADRRRPTIPVTLRPKDYLKNVAEKLTAAIEVQRDDAARSRRMNDATLRRMREMLDVVQTGRADVRTLTSLARASLDCAEQLDRHLAVLAPDVGPSESTAPAAAPAPIESPAAA